MTASPLHENGHPYTESSVDMFHFSGKTLTCGIDLGDDMKGSHGLETGFAYEVLKDFARDHNCRISIITADKDNDLMESLKKGGRISPAVAAIGSMLKLRPVLRLQGEALEKFNM